MHPALTTYASYTNSGMIDPAFPGTLSLSSPPPPGSASSSLIPSVVGGRASSVGDRGCRRRRRSIGLGVVQASLGALCIVFNAVSLAFYDGRQTQSIAFVGHGFWIGMLFIVTGSLGLAAGKSRTRCIVTAFMTMCIISATFAVFILSLGVAGAIAATKGKGYSCVQSESGSTPYGFSYYYPYFYRPPCYTFQVLLAMEVCMATAGFLESIATIVGAVVSYQSSPICCCTGTPRVMLLPVSCCPNNGHVLYLTQAQERLHVVYALPPSMSFSQGAITAPYSCQTNYSPSVQCRPQQKIVAGGATTGSDTPPNSPPPPYPSDSHLWQPKDCQQKY